MSRKPGYYLHLASIPQLIIDSASAVMNSKNRLHFPQCHILLNVSHLFATTALGGRKRMGAGQGDSHTILSSCSPYRVGTVLFSKRKN